MTITELQARILAVQERLLPLVEQDPEGELGEIASDLLGVHNEAVRLGNAHTCVAA